MKNTFRISTPKISVTLVAGLWIFAASLRGASSEPDLERLPTAHQTGGSCGFFANVPALTLATGIDIDASKSFVQSIYGLRRGDFRYQRSFDKRMFYELFSIGYEETKIEHPEGIAKAMLADVKKLITETFDAGLSKGLVYSLRIRGVFNGPHNGLLIGRKDGKYLLHDPYPGVNKKLSLDDLAKTIEPVREVAVGAGVGDFIEAYPELDFAALPGDEKKTKPRNVIGRDLKAEELSGLLHLSKFTLNVWVQNRRPLLPIVFMDDQPWVLVRYLETDPIQPNRATLVFDNGKELLWLDPSEALVRIRKNGALYATMRLDWEGEVRR